MFTYNDIRLKLLTDATFYHDAFRTDYPHSNDAIWVFHYAVYRSTFAPDEKIIVLGRPILDSLEQKFLNYKIYRPGVLRVIERIAEVYQIQGISPDLATIYAAISIVTSNQIPIIISSMKKERWLERIKGWGVSCDLEGFTDVMSEKRIERNFPCFIVNPANVRRILHRYDSLFQRVMRSFTS